MDIFCTHEFYTVYLGLAKQKAYRELGDELAEYFFRKDAEDLESGRRLNGNCPIPYIKKRIEGSGGYRIYYLLQISESKSLLLFIHPKNGPDGSENIKDKFKKLYYKQGLEALKSENYLRLKLDKESGVLKFLKIEKKLVVIKKDKLK